MGQGVNATAEAEDTISQTRTGPGKAAPMLQGGTLYPGRLLLRRQLGPSCFVEDVEEG